MNELTIQAHDFTKEKNGLKTYSQTPAEEMKLNLVQWDGGPFDWFDHKVTGRELNNRLLAIQDYLVLLCTSTNKTITEFGQVYQTFEALDREYIQGIIKAIDGVKKTATSLVGTQTKLKKVVEDQEKTIEVLKLFKKRLDGYAHLDAIDTLWKNHQTSLRNLETLSKTVDKTKTAQQADAKKIQHLEVKLERLEAHTKGLVGQIQTLNNWTSQLSQLEHLLDIDTLWETTQLQSVALAELGEEYAHGLSLSTQNKEDLDTLWKHKETLGNHVSALLTGQAAQQQQMETLEEQLTMLRQENDGMKQAFQAQETQHSQALATVSQKHDAVLETCFQKIKTAYWIGGVSLTLALVELVAIVVKVF